MSKQGKPGAAAKPPAERQAAWYEEHKSEFKQLTAKLPPALAERFTAAIRAQGKTFQGWLREQAEEMTKGDKNGIC